MNVRCAAHYYASDRQHANQYGMEQNRTEPYAANIIITIIQTDINIKIIHPRSMYPQNVYQLLLSHHI